MTEPILAEGTTEMMALESLVDRVGMRNVLYALAVICDGKAEHIRSNWQDDTLAGDWRARGAKIESFAAKLTRES